MHSNIAFAVAVDSESSLKMMKMLLRKLDVVADTAENGRIAVDMVMGAAEPYHLVLMDNLMPEMVTLTQQDAMYIVVIFSDFGFSNRMEWKRLGCCVSRDARY